MKIFYSIALLLLASNLSFSQTTVTITADKDNTMYENGNSNGAGENFFAGVTASGSKRRGLIHFDLSSIPTNAVVTAVTLTVTCNKLASSSAGIKLHKVNSNWGQGTSDAGGNEGGGASPTTNDATWTNRMHPSTAWATPGGDFSATVTVNNNSVAMGAVPFSGTTGSNLVADVQSFVASPANNFGWIVIGTNESTNTTALRFATMENGTASTGPSLRVTYTTNLPISLSKFTASLSKGNGILQWQTVTEINNSYFDLEHSRDGINFSPIGRLQGNGNTTTKHDYSFTHNNIPSGKNYYRLSQYDVNGARQYSPIVLLTGSKKSAIDIYPNPAQNYLQINAPFLLEKVEYSIVNFGGQVIQKGMLNGKQIQIDKLAAGQYYISILSQDGEWHRSSFLKK